MHTMAEFQGTLVGSLKSMIMQVMGLIQLQMLAVIQVLISLTLLSRLDMQLTIIL